MGFTDTQWRLLRQTWRSARIFDIDRIDRRYALRCALRSADAPANRRYQPR